MKKEKCWFKVCQCVHVQRALTVISTWINNRPIILNTSEPDAKKSVRDFPAFSLFLYGRGYVLVAFKVLAFIMCNIRPDFMCRVEGSALIRGDLFGCFRSSFILRFFLVDCVVLVFRWNEIRDMYEIYYQSQICRIIRKTLNKLCTRKSVSHKSCNLQS